MRVATPLVIQISRMVSTSSPLILKHSLPREQTERICFLERSKVKKAKGLIRENPVSWTPKKLASYFKVPVSVVQAHVPRPTKRVLKTFRQLNKDFSLPFKDRFRTPNQIRLDEWQMQQTAKTPVHKAQRKKWKQTTYQEMENIDMPWLLGLEKKMSGLHEKAVIKLDKERRERAKFAPPEKSGKLQKKTKKKT